MTRGEAPGPIAAEDKSFFLAVVAADPLDAGSFVLRSIWTQLGEFELVNFNYPDFGVTELYHKYPDRIAAQIAASRAANGTMPTALTVVATVAVSGLALAAAIGLGLACRRRAIAVRPEIARFAAILLFGVLANAVICGAFSKPTARYQMRLVWLLPLAVQVGASGARRGPAVAERIGST